MTDDKLFEFAKECAAAYCRKHGDASQFDEATSEACDWLLSNRHLWTLPKGALKWRTVRRLVRWYQDEHGLRKTSPTSFVDVDEYANDVRLSSKEDARLLCYIEQQEVDDLVIRAATQAWLLGVFDLVRAWVLELGTREELSARFGIPLSSLDRMRRRFKRELKKLVGVHGVVIVDSATDEELVECPLFLYLTDASASS